MTRGIVEWCLGDCISFIVWLGGGLGRFLGICLRGFWEVFGRFFTLWWRVCLGLLELRPLFEWSWRVCLGFLVFFFEIIVLVIFLWVFLWLGGVWFNFLIVIFIIIRVIVIGFVRGEEGRGLWGGEGLSQIVWVLRRIILGWIWCLILVPFHFYYYCFFIIIIYYY